MESTPSFIRIANQPLAEPIRFASSAGPNTRLITRLVDTHRFEGPVRDIPEAEGCTGVDISGNTGFNR